MTGYSLNSTLLPHRSEAKLMPSRLYGVHAAVFAGAWDADGAERAVSGAMNAGFDVIEVPVFEPTRIDVRGTASLLEQAGLKATCSLGLPFSADLSSLDENVSRRGIDYLCAAVDVAVGIGSDIVTGVTYGAFGRHEGPLALAGRRASLRGLKRVALYAADRGVSIGLECVNRYESNLLNTAEQALEYLNELASPNVFVHLDSYHVNIEEASPVEAILRCGDKLGYVHVGENHRGALGTGQIDLQLWAGALEKIDYRGIVTFESFSSTIVDSDLSNTLAVWRDTWTDSAHIASDARRTLADTFSLATGS